MLRMRRWGNGGAVSNARTELTRAHDQQVAASVVARRVEDRELGTLREVHPIASGAWSTSAGRAAPTSATPS